MAELPLDFPGSSGRRTVGMQWSDFLSRTRLGRAGSQWKQGAVERKLERRILTPPPMSCEALGSVHHLLDHQLPRL